MSHDVVAGAGSVRNQLTKKRFRIETGATMERKGSVSKRPVKGWRQLGCLQQCGGTLDAESVPCMHCKRRYHPQCCIAAGVRDILDQSPNESGVEAFACSYCANGIAAGYAKGIAHQKCVHAASKAAGKKPVVEKWTFYCEEEGCDRTRSHGNAFEGACHLNQHMKAHGVGVPTCPHCARAIKCGKAMKKHKAHCLGGSSCRTHWQLLHDGSFRG